MSKRIIQLVCMAIASGCSEPEPDWLYRGEWIDIAGHGRTADETCAGTFVYLDRYANALSVEFGVNQHLGAYHWYSRELFEAEKPCGTNAYGCLDSDGAASWSIPVDHELSHMTNDIRGAPCPSLLEEGLAVYFSTEGATPLAEHFDLLAKRFGAVDQALPAAEYLIAGQFVGFLVREYGLESVLDVCEKTGYKPDPEKFASVMISVFGAAPEQLLTEMASDSQCLSWERFQSRVFVCGKAGAASHAGAVDDELRLGYRMGCGEKTTVSSKRWGGTRNRIRTIEQIDFLHSGPHLVSMVGADNEIPPVELIVAPCEPCDMVWSFLPGDAFGPIMVEAGPHWLELRADEDFTGEFALRFSRLP